MKKFSVYLLFGDNSVVHVEAQDCALTGEEYKFTKQTGQIVLRVPSGNVHYILISELPTTD